MPLILRIAHQDLLIGDDAPVATLLKVLQRAMVVEDRTYDWKDRRVVITRPCEVEIKTVNAGTRIVDTRDGRDEEIVVPTPNGSRPGTRLVTTRRRRPARSAAYPLLESEP